MEFVPIHLNPFALQTAKTLWSFGHFKCKRDKKVIILEGNSQFHLVPGNLIVPITARNVHCVEKIRDFVCNNRYNIGLLGMLSQSMLSCEQRQPIRAFIQLGPKEEGIESFSSF